MSDSECMVIPAKFTQPVYQRMYDLQKQDGKARQMVDISDPLAFDQRTGMVTAEAITNLGERISFQYDIRECEWRRVH